ncbi:DUF1761 domain-containing protein [Winogradskyella alexanderae]|uniref:DUF1761 domain-containing protein n=1 Tax=Winogradskyella alexanderae TaxID=2877123 RepID=A0ABS7XMN4_9FLAO|nr:DUF1761 domain-containing protein [Winogradskyella alexanderae]MCA0131267.1 DUF1761 domain-containing protein [Winogradskyella alexanderae]
MELNFMAIVVAAIVPLVIGAVWYNPAVLGTAWMKASGMTEEKMKSGNIGIIFGITLVLSFMLAFSVNGMVIHQVAAQQLAFTNPDAESFKAFMEEFGNMHRSFGHGALHGAIGALFFVLPVLGINALFERKGWKYILINFGYWLVALTVMGAILCGWS